MSTERTIWKFPVPVHDDVVLRIPQGAEFRHAAPSPTDQHVVDTWWEVDPAAAVEHVVIHVVGTGHPIPPSAHEHLATVPMPGGLVWHLRRDHSKPRVFVLDRTHLSAVRSAPWYAGQKIVDRDLRGYTLHPADIIVGDLARRDLMDLSLLARTLPDGITPADLVREV